MAAVNVSVDYKFTPRRWQDECRKKMKRFSVLAVHRRAGKTTFAIGGVLIPKALEKKGLYAYIAPELKQAKLIAWKALKDACAQFQKLQAGKETVDLCEFRESELIIRFWNGSEIRLFGADNPDSLRGSKLAGAIIDEVAQMPKELWLEIVYPALMDSKGFAMFIGTPKGVNLFSELFDKGLSPEFQDTWVAMKFTCYETDALNPVDIEEYKRSVPEEVFKREMLCDFSASGANQLCSIFEVQEATHRHVEEAWLAHAPLLLGVDVARFGADSSVLAFRRGSLAYEPILYHGLDLVELTNLVIMQVREKRPEAIFVDGTGLGGGVVDMLNNSIHLMGEQVIVYDINFGKKSAHPMYANLRTEMWANMVTWIRQGGCLPPDDVLVSEIAMPTYDFNEKGVMTLETKKQLRDRLGRSPDKADALALTFAEVVSDNRGFEDAYRINQRLGINQYSDPFSRFERDVRGW